MLPPCPAHLHPQHPLSVPLLHSKLPAGWTCATSPPSSCWGSPHTSWGASGSTGCPRASSRSSGREHGAVLQSPCPFEGTGDGRPLGMAKREAAAGLVTSPVLLPQRGLCKGGPPASPNAASPELPRGREGNPHSRS